MLCFVSRAASQVLSSALQTRGITIYQNVQSPAPGRLAITAVHPPYIMVADAQAAETTTDPEAIGGAGGWSAQVRK